MRGGEGVVVEVAGDDRRLEVLGQRSRLVAAAGHHHAAPDQDHRELRLGQHLRRLVQALRTARPALDPLGRGDARVELAVEVVARDVDLHRTALRHRDRERPVGELGDPIRPAHVGLEPGDLREDRHLIGLLEATQTHARAAGLRGDGDHRGVGPVGGGDRGHEVGDPRTVLADADAVAIGRPRVAVGHVGGVLLVGHGDEADPGGREDIEGVHVGGADDAEDVRHALGGELLDEGL